MRLLVVSQYFWPENFRINDLVAELGERGHQVTVLTGLPNYPQGDLFDEFRKHPSAFSAFAGARVVRVPMVLRKSGRLRLLLNYLTFAISAAVAGAWKLRGERFDAIFVFQPSPVTSVLPALLLRATKRAPLLLWVLDLWPDTLAAVGVVRSPAVLALVGRLVAFIYRRCERILVPAQSSFANVERYAGNRSRIRYFPGWAEPVFDAPADNATPAPELASLRERFVVLFAGNVGEAQDFPAVLDAVERLRDVADVRWVVVGDGRMSAWLDAEIERRGLRECVLPLGRFPIDRMPDFFRAASALLVSLKGEPVFAMTIPAKVQAYLAAGTPVLAMLDGEGARVVAESGGGLVCPAGRGDLLAARVLELRALSPEARSAMSQRGQAYCRAAFNRATLVGQLEGWLEEAVAERREKASA